MNLYLIRHGESEGNVAGKIQGQADYVLTEEGRQQAALVGKYIEEIGIDYLYSSDLLRAFETAEIVSTAVKIRPQAWELVREVHLGPLQNLTRDEIYEKYPQTVESSIITSGIEGTESSTELTKRCEAVVEQLLQIHRNQDVAIVSHGGFISVFLMYLIIGDKWPAYKRPFRIGNTSVTHIEWKDDQTSPVIHYTNQQEHLRSQHFKQRGLL